MNEPRPEKPTISNVWEYFRDLFDLHGGTEEKLTVGYIKENIAFKGENLWMLAFSILICSIGLNINSTAVIIGAMLISPLMGPIFGAGLSIGINDWETLKQSLTSLLVAVIVSVVTSSIYFFITPIREAQSELLARTFPTLYDVLIAAFGGATGVIAISRKEKSNAIPGVAIATALMPPLCTAGYGLARGEFLEYFLGALYLFVINSVFICLTTVVFIRFWNFRKKEFLNATRERKVHRYILIVAVVTIIPSLFTVYRLVQETVFNSNANRFISEQVESESRRVAIKTVEYSVFGPGPSSIEVWTMGDPISPDQEEEIKSKLPEYDLAGTELDLNQGDTLDSENLRSQIQAGLFEDIVRRNEATIESKDQIIDNLTKEIDRLRQFQQPVDDIAYELKTHHDNLEEFSYSLMIGRDLEKKWPDSLGVAPLDTIPTVVLNWTRSPRQDQLEDIRAFLLRRMRVDTLQIINRQ